MIEIEIEFEKAIEQIKSIPLFSSELDFCHAFNCM